MSRSILNQIITISRRTHQFAADTYEIDARLTQFAAYLIHRIIGICRQKNTGIARREFLTHDVEHTERRLARTRRTDNEKHLACLLSPKHKVVERSIVARKHFRRICFRLALCEDKVSPPFGSCEKGLHS